MKLQPLPSKAKAILAELHAPPRLLAHLIIVHDVAFALTLKLEESWPELRYNREAVIFGAATHDIGKVLHTNEITGPGSQHEESGQNLLMERGISAEYARFARTHGQWDHGSIKMEDMIVALADKIWKGKRDEKLEFGISQSIAEEVGEELWSVYSELDAILSEIAEDASERLSWQSDGVQAIDLYEYIS